MEEFYCHPCHAHFQTKGYLTTHVSRKHGVKCLPCPHCDKNLSSQGNLDRHTKSRHPDKHGYVCSFCTLVFDKITTYRIHLKTHVSTRFACDVCDKSFDKPSQLKDHTHSHTNEKGFKCDTCTSQFPTRLRLIRHNKIHQPRREACDQCEASFHEKAGLRRHLASVHSDEQNFACGVCDKKFKLSEKLVLHLKRHTTPRPHKCNICQVAYSQKRTLIKHRTQVHGITVSNYTG